jgi:hypothetical protein
VFIRQVADLHQKYPVLSARETIQKESKRKEPGILHEKNEEKINREIKLDSEVAYSFLSNRPDTLTHPVLNI